MCKNTETQVEAQRTGERTQDRAQYRRLQLKPTQGQLRNTMTKYTSDDETQIKTNQGQVKLERQLKLVGNSKGRK